MGGNADSAIIDGPGVTMSIKGRNACITAASTKAAKTNGNRGTDTTADSVNGTAYVDATVTATTTKALNKGTLCIITKGLHQAPQGCIHITGITPFPAEPTDTQSN